MQEVAGHRAAVHVWNQAGYTFPGRETTRQPAMTSEVRAGSRPMSTCITSGRGGFRKRTAGPARPIRQRVGRSPMADPDFTYGPNARSRPGWCRDCTGTSRSRRRSHLASRRAVGGRSLRAVRKLPLLCRRPADPFRRAAKTTRVRPSGVRLSGANSGLNEATSSRLIRDGRGLAWLQGGQYLASKRSSLTAHHASAESSRAGRCPSPGGPIYRVRRVSFRTTSGAVGAKRPGWFGLPARGGRSRSPSRQLRYRCLPTAAVQ